MSTIKLEIEVSAENVRTVAQFLEAIAGSAKSIAKMDVVDAEEVKAPAPTKTPTPRPSRAKAKPAPVVEEPEDDEDEDDDFGAADAPIEDDEEESITADDLRAAQAAKIDKHRAELKAQYNKLGATGIKDLDEKHYQKMFDFISKLK